MTSGRRKVIGVLLGNVVLLAGSRDRAGRQAELCSRFWLDGEGGGLRLYSLIGWYPWQDSGFRRGQRPSFTIGWTFGLYSDIRMGMQNMPLSCAALQGWLCSPGGCGRCPGSVV